MTAAFLSTVLFGICPSSWFTPEYPGAQYAVVAEVNGHSSLEEVRLANDGREDGLGWNGNGWVWSPPESFVAVGFGVPFNGSGNRSPYCEQPVTLKIYDEVPSPTALPQATPLVTSVISHAPWRHLWMVDGVIQNDRGNSEPYWHFFEFQGPTQFQAGEDYSIGLQDLWALQIPMTIAANVVALEAWGLSNADSNGERAWYRLPPAAGQQFFQPVFKFHGSQAIPEPATWALAAAALLLAGGRAIRQRRR
jgi:hypothetical protein